jgi:FAM192A/Fyv6, N-terminal domain
MSLSFVSKAVLTVKEDGGYEETAVEGKGGDGVRSRVTSSQPLFEQLRANKEQEEMEREEFQKSIMRGTLALDEEDCAHLDAVQKQRQEREIEIKRETQSELESFRVAQAINRMEQGIKHDEDEDEKRQREEELVQRRQQALATAAEKPVAATKAQFPKIVAKRRRKTPTVVDAKDGLNATANKKLKENSNISTPAPAPDPAGTEKTGLSGLLAGYGSDSDSD